MSNSAIDTAAGIVWKYLHDNGSASVTKIATETEIQNKDVQRAIGWLAKEDKLLIEINGRVEIISLK